MLNFIMDRKDNCKPGYFYKTNAFTSDADQTFLLKCSLIFIRINLRTISWIMNY